jgi:hypothetical protein
MDPGIPWRRTAIAAGAVALIELVALLAVGAAALGRPLAQTVAARAEKKDAAASAARQTPAAPLPKAPVVPRLSRARTSVLVLNGNGRQGAASSQAVALQTLGYRVGATGNAARSDYAASIVMYRPGYRPEARRLARDAGIRIVGPLDGLRLAELKGSQLALIVGSST